MPPRSSTPKKVKPAVNKKTTSSSKSGSTATAKTTSKSKAAAKLKSAESSIIVKKKVAGTKSKGEGRKLQDIEGDTVELVAPPVAQKMMDLLCRRYPDADCELDFDSDFQLLTAVIMSAQTTDAQVNKVAPELFRRFPDAKSLADADPEEVKVLIKPTGYFNAKTQSIMNCAKALVEKFGGKVPDNLEELVTLPGVGRKTANVVLGVIHKQPAWTVDTHVQRLTKRLGFTHETDPYKIELDLQKLFPQKNWSQYSITLIWHGRRLCYARKPDCPNCPINHLCPSAQL